jgi:hypothetical protein
MGWWGEVWLKNGNKILIEECCSDIGKDEIKINGFVHIGEHNLGYMKLNIGKVFVAKVVESKSGGRVEVYRG